MVCSHPDRGAAPSCTAHEVHPRRRRSRASGARGLFALETSKFPQKKSAFCSRVSWGALPAPRGMCSPVKADKAPQVRRVPRVPRERSETAQTPKKCGRIAFGERIGENGAQKCRRIFGLAPKCSPVPRARQSAAPLLGPAAGLWKTRQNVSGFFANTRGQAGAHYYCQALGLEYGSPKQMRPESSDSGSLGNAYGRAFESCGAGLPAPYLKTLHNIRPPGPSK